MGFLAPSQVWSRCAGNRPCSEILATREYFTMPLTASRQFLLPLPSLKFPCPTRLHSRAVKPRVANRITRAPPGPPRVRRGRTPCRLGSRRHGSFGNPRYKGTRRAWPKTVGETFLPPTMSQRITAKSPPPAPPRPRASGSSNPPGRRPSLTLPAPALKLIAVLAAASGTGACRLCPAGRWAWSKLGAVIPSQSRRGLGVHGQAASAIRQAEVQGPKRRRLAVFSMTIGED